MYYSRHSFKIYFKNDLWLLYYPVSNKISLFAMHWETTLKVKIVVLPKGNLPDSNLKFGKLLKKIMLLHKKCYGNRLFISTWIKFGSDIRPTRGNTEAVQTLMTSQNYIIIKNEKDYELSGGFGVCGLKAFLSKYLPL